MSHAALVARLNKLCAQRNAALSQESQEYARLSKVRDYDGLAAVIEKAATKSAPFDAKVRQLRAGPADRRALDRYKRALVRQRGIGVRLPAAFRAHDDPTLRVLQQATVDNAKLQLNAASELGADKCGI